MQRKKPITFAINTSVSSNEQNPLYSVNETVEGLRWTIEVYADQLDGNYIFKIDCRGPTPASGNWLWSCNALCRFDVVNNDDIDTCNYHTYISGVLNSSNCYSHHKMVNLDRHFINKGSFEVELRIYAYRLFKMNLQLPVDKESESDAQILVDGRRYYINKKLLAMHSDFFKRLIDQGVTTINVPQTNRQHFLAFLLFIFPADTRITLANIADYVYIALGFECHAMITACGDFLAQESPMSTVDRLHLAQQLHLPSVMQKIVQDLIYCEVDDARARNIIGNIRYLLRVPEVHEEVKERIRTRAAEMGYPDQCSRTPPVVILD